ncbi:hypothetical protein BDN72DRAFT_856118 [Pluteus cervinus]|uniref:Uncharacterized protein n=1 Tax=Pluteus cervinus TaxID=181527 RepID=A0ACD3B0E0_9AGAR|nr:hypothetical protein BDN72DRAFT_856118 [Pluteus cervinus]
MSPTSEERIPSDDMDVDHPRPVGREGNQIIQQEVIPRGRDPCGVRPFYCFLKRPLRVLGLGVEMEVGLPGHYSLPAPRLFTQILVECLTEAQIQISPDSQMRLDFVVTTEVPEQVTAANIQTLATAICRCRDSLQNLAQLLVMKMPAKPIPRFQHGLSTCGGFINLRKFFYSGDRANLFHNLHDLRLDKLEKAFFTNCSLTLADRWFLQQAQSIETHLYRSKRMDEQRPKGKASERYKGSSIYCQGFYGRCDKLDLTIAKLSDEAYIKLSQQVRVNGCLLLRGPWVNEKQVEWLRGKAVQSLCEWSIGLKQVFESEGKIF